MGFAAGLFLVQMERLRGTGGLHRVTGVAASMLMGAFATGAIAQEPPSPDSNPWEYGERAAQQGILGQDVVPDTDATPRTKDGSKIWQQISGVRFPGVQNSDGETPIAGSFTSYKDNLFAVSFRNSQYGYIGGARCDDPNPDAEKDCRPVLYRYTDDAAVGKIKVWETVPLPGQVAAGEGGDPGFIGAIAWIDDDRALAVGGSGTHPRREPRFDQPGCNPSDAPPASPWGAGCDQAGMARAWLIRADTGSVCELKPEGEESANCAALPKDDPATPRFEGMRGLTAVDFKPPVEGADPEEIGFVGGLGQIWRWRATKDSPEGGFDRLYDPESAPTDLSAGSGTDSEPRSPSAFRFRVRAIRFQPTRETVAYAATTGCCTSALSDDKALFLRYSHRSVAGAAAPGWDLAAPSTSTDDPARIPDPESFYGMTVRNPKGISGGLHVSLLASTAREPSQTEGRSRIICEEGYANSKHSLGGGARPPAVLSTGRFVALDGGSSTVGFHACPVTADWAVGELRGASSPGRGRRGLVGAPRRDDRTPRSNDAPDPIADGNLVQGLQKFAQNDLGQYGQELLSSPRAPTDERRLRAHLASLDLLVDSYALNGVDVVGAHAYAVGDHGAILQFASSRSVADRAKLEPPGATLGERRPRALAEKGSLDESRPSAPEHVGGAPSLASRPRDRLREPALFGWGSPDASLEPGAAGSEPPSEDVAEIVMSRDGREGWAVGTSVIGRRDEHSFAVTDSSAFYGVASFYHYEGTAWRRCDPVGVPNQLEADPACASVAGLRLYRVGEEKRRVQIIGAARVPLERDSDPRNDDEFEIVAIGTRYRGPEQPADDDPVILRYKDGRWRFEEREVRKPVTNALSQAVDDEPGLQPGTPNTVGQGSLVLKDVAFTAPDDGWILARSSVTSSNGLGGIHRLFHFDGKRWEECARVAGSCLSPRVPRLESSARLMLTSAGERAYLYGRRLGSASSLNPPLVGDTVKGLTVRPLILYRDRGGEWTDGSGEGEDGGGLDPGCVRIETVNGVPECIADPNAPQGRVYALTVTRREDGTYEGFANGRFSNYAVPPDPLSDQTENAKFRITPVSSILLRLERDGGRYRWESFRDPGALEDYMWPQVYGALLFAVGNHRQSEQRRMAMIAPAGGGPARALIAQQDHGRLFEFEPSEGRFELMDWDMPIKEFGWESSAYAMVQAVAPDGVGGAWVAVKNQWCEVAYACPRANQVFFYRYTDRPNRAVFRETAHPLGSRDNSVTSTAGAPDGSVWVTTESSLLARYDRLAGWETVRVPGWNAGRLVTRESSANAVALGEDGKGVVVGDQGRIANVSGSRVALDSAAGRRCVDSPPPCSSGRDLRAAAVGPDGSVLAGGDALTLLWRPPGGEFQAVSRPQGSDSIRITGISLPSPSRAYLTTSAGHLYRGDLLGGDWSWRIENLRGRTVIGGEIPLRAVAVRSDGRGYAVGDRGVVLYREGDSSAPWRRIRGPGSDDLTAVTLPRGKGEAVLIGGRNGVIWTGEGDELAPARPGDFFRMHPDNEERFFAGGSHVGPVVGLALVPGAEDGQVEAWAAIQARGTATNRLLHYASEEEEPLLNPDRRAEPLPDAPTPREGELRIAAFGKSDCNWSSLFVCPPMLGTIERSELIARRIGKELGDRAEGLDMTLFTGDVSDSTGYPSGGPTKDVPIDPRSGYPPATSGSGPVIVPSQWDAFAGRLKLGRWSEMVADPIERSGLPLLGTSGPGDLSRPVYDCDSYDCRSPSEPAKSGENVAWREGMERRRAPWGKGERGEGKLSFTQTPGSTTGSQPLPDAKADPDGERGFLDPVEMKGGARTHYASEISRGGEKIARLVVTDTSLRSLSASDAIQNPIERDGQLRWLERMLCFKGQVPTGGGDCTREPGQEAIVLSNTPTYSYGAGALDGTQTDGAAMERVLLKYQASVVISGRLGFNGRYWATAPGLHEPCVGDSYRDEPPQPGTRLCGRDTESIPGSDRAPAAAEQLGKSLGGLGPPPAPVTDAQEAVDRVAGEQNPTGLVPFVIASGAGGKFGPNGEHNTGTASQGFWHGYSIVRVDGSGDPRGVIVEQRPVLDWLSLSASEHVLRPGQRLKLRGVGREPIGFVGEEPATRYDAIDSAAITHRYDLLEADPKKPYVPRRDADGNYVPLDPRIATVDSTTGQVRAGRGNHPRAYAVALLSVGEKAATWPMVFEPRKSFTPPPAARLPALALSRATPAIRTLAQSPSVPPQPPAQAPPPVGASPTLPETPALPTPPPPFNAATAQPPPPFSPPPPPPPQLPSALDLIAQPPSVPLAPQATVIPPPAPPIQPAPPGGARREARQRQAAVQKGEEGGGSGAETPGDTMADSPHSPDQAAMTRLQRHRAEAGSFTMLRGHDQPSAWARGALYGGTLTLFALVASLTWIGTRPGDRRDRRTTPAPALARRRRLR